MSRTRDLQDEISRTKYPLRPPIPFKFRNFPTPSKRYYSYNDRDELRRKMLCFSYQEPWVPSHKCVKGKAHYLEALFKSDEEIVEEIDI